MLITTPPATGSNRAKRILMALNNPVAQVGSHASSVCGHPKGQLADRRPVKLAKAIRRALRSVKFRQWSLDER